jgi:N-acyl-D-amino-acid deacylase
MSEENLQRFLRLPYMMIGSDSAVRSFSGVTRNGKPHPRGFGSFPRFLGAYVRNQNLMPMAEAVRRMTSLPASVFGLDRRGLIREGWHADLALFDPDTIADTATFDEPFRRPDGIIHVFVNGIPCVLHGEPTGTRSGAIL